MKKLLIILSIFITIILASCGKKNNDKVEFTGNTTSDANKSSLVLYFSNTNNTKNIADKISNTLNIDIVEIKP